MPLSSKFKYFGVLSFYLFNIQLQAEPVQTAVISEFLTNNNKALEDSNGQNYDWIEVSNVNRENGDLEGYHLTDDPLNLTKWTFPKKEFNDDGFILVFASGKDLKDPNNDLHTNFKLSSSDGGFLALIKPDGATIASKFNSYPRQYEDVSFGSGYGEPKDVKFLAEGDAAKWHVPSAPIGGWTETTFNDASWSSGKTGIGYDNSTKYIPHIGNGSDVKSVMRGINASIYIRIPFNLTDASGISNLTLWMKWEDGFVAYLNGKKIHSISAPDDPEWNSSSTSNRSNENDAITFFDYPVSGPLQKGQNILAIQGLNGSQSSSDFLISPELTARKTDLNSPQNGYFLDPTPGTINGKRIDGLVGDTKFDVNRGFYEDPFELEISTETEGAKIRYTLDGTAPSETEGTVYNSPIRINETTVIRALAYKPGYSSTNIDTNTYVFPADVVEQRTMSTSITENAKYKPLMLDSLKAIPSISLSFESPNTLNTEKERPLSIEMIFPDGTKGFQENAGVTHFGGYYTNFSKKNFRIYFRSEYGATKLRYPIYEGVENQMPPAQEFDSINLRSGSHDMIDRGAYMSNRFTDDSMLEMGHIAPHGRFVHVYLNGTYWGMYHLRERWNGAMASEYLGGSKEDYEAINANNSGSEFLQGVVFDGTGKYWTETRNLINGNSPFSASANHIDIPNVIDFMLLWTSGNSESEFRSVGSVPLGVPYKFFMKDADGFLRNPGHPVTHNGPLNALTRFRREGDPDYKILLADQIHKHFFNDGAMTPNRLTSRLQRRVDEVKVPFLAEAARWTNVRGGRANHSPTSWEAYQNNLLNNQLPRLTANMMTKFRSAGMYPNLISPVFNQHGGSIPEGFSITMSTNTLAIYYTTNGDDPRLSGGSINPQAIAATFNDKAPIPKDYIKNGHVWKYLDDGSNQGDSWFGRNFDDSQWPSGPSELGYSEGDEATLISYIDSDDAPGTQRNATTYFRTSVNLPEPSAYSFFILKLKYDDAAAVYANGSEIIRTKNLPADAGYDTYATSGTPNERIYHEYQIPSSSFVDGANQIAVEIHNSSPNSSDISFDLVLRGEVDTSVGSRITSPVILNDPSLVRARAYNPSNREWSALNEAFFSIGSVPANSSNFKLTELHYHPEEPSSENEMNVSADRDDYEFVEFLNTASSPIDLSNIHFEDGINFTFSENTILNPDQRIVIVRNENAFRARYGNDPKIFIGGEYTGRFSNDGERLFVKNGATNDIVDFTYNDQAPWPIAADGTGPSLVLAGETPNNPLSWKENAVKGGQPGYPDGTVSSGFNEWKETNQITDNLGDNDADGLINLIEYAFNTNPNIAEPLANPRAKITIVEGKQFLEITYTENIQATDTDIKIQLSHDLKDWSPESQMEIIRETISDDKKTKTITARTSNPISSLKDTYFRFNISL
ncbi:MAG: hypothetical protein GWP42_10165 [Verrucomicrobiales bacterium]|nr:hypothetical protein [Verrucomicrobiales bacterium]